MKVNVVPKKEKSLKFPFIGIDNGFDFVVLFTSKNSGVVLQKGESDKEVGYISNNLDISTFEPFLDVIELSND